jgi:hypothetical protein
MAGPDGIEWRRSFPARALRVFAWYAVGAMLVVAVVWLLFGSEPEHLDTGAANPLADIPMWTAVLAAVGAVIALLPVLRRPSVAANHYALIVRPDALRTLMLPWASIAQVVVTDVGDEPYLLVRMLVARESLGDRPGWWDQAVLRAARRALPGRRGSRLSGYHLAVRMREFAGRPDAQLGTLAAYAPESVVISDRL